LRHEPAPETLHVVELNLEDLTYSLKSLMWREMGVQRSGPALGEALKRLTFWARAVEALPLESPRAWELINMLTVARLATFSALGRCESRGVHWRTDFPVPGPVAFHQELVPHLVNGSVERVDLRRVAVPEAQLLRE
jgi:L-aspartate oxidase